MPTFSVSIYGSFVTTSLRYTVDRLDMIDPWLFDQLSEFIGREVTHQRPVHIIGQKHIILAFLNPHSFCLDSNFMR